MSELKKKYFNPFREEEIAYIERNYEKLTIRQMAMYLGRTEASVRGKIRTLQESMSVRRDMTLHKLAIGMKL